MTTETEPQLVRRTCPDCGFRDEYSAAEDRCARCEAPFEPPLDPLTSGVAHCGVCDTFWRQSFLIDVVCPECGQRVCIARRLETLLAMK